MNEPGFSKAVARLVDILCDLDEFDRPKIKLPNCPKCDEDELGVIHADLMLCYHCGWKIIGRTPPMSPEAEALNRELSARVAGKAAIEEGRKAQDARHNRGILG